MYRSIFENAIEGIFQTTPGGQYLNVNPALAKMYGYDSVEDLVAGLTVIDNQLYVDSNRRPEFVRLMKENGAVCGFEAEIYRKDRSTMWISENARCILDAEDNIGYVADVAANGLEALSALDVRPHDLILMDCQLPELDGYETTQRIRTRSDASGIRIIAMTANAMRGESEKCLEAGMDNYLSKPVRLEALRDMLARWMPAERKA